MRTEGIFKFGEFQIDALARTLRREEAIVTLNRRAFDVLLYLVQNPGKIVSRDELLKNVWSDTFVDENSLAQSISALRRALEEKPGDNNYIVTLPGRGYQFVSQVQVVAPENLSTVPGAATVWPGLPAGCFFRNARSGPVSSRKKEQSLSLPHPRNRAVVGLVAVLVIAATVVAGYYAWTRFHRAQQLNACGQQFRLCHSPQPAVPSRSLVFATCLAVPKKAGYPRPWRKC